MKKSARRAPVRLTEPQALRALAHPTRLALVALLRHRGPMTATQAAAELGETPQRCTFHLRVLARYGLVEEAGGGRGRERPWQASGYGTSWPSVPPTREMAAASRLLERVFAERYFGWVMDWVERKSGEPRLWQRAAQFGDNLLYMTAAELQQLNRAQATMVKQFRRRRFEARLRPQGSRPVRFLEFRFPASEADIPSRRR